MDAELRGRFRLAISAAMNAWEGKSAQWGVDDCSLALSDIDMVVIGIDSAAEYRGRYDTEEGARALLGRAGLVGGWGRVAKQNGWPRLAKKHFGSAEDGDRAVATTPAGPTSVIRYRGFWVGRLDRGNLLVTDAQIIRAWKVC